ncbi:class I SAM-dependent methyltransferase [Truepera radiovictrix]|uniref:Methyltransferase type 11 n=1 Tax=Truepera radiovictrix (strain DSM 17093 / CIP 108686 / LMG 22925 / RQ-24) TaxID=649638 RepID=D7CSA9_TRURR|nr:class I SAM-dependent methyltransferase [Truepera radiovictrix]ADI13641.1 Methyltransferase type 11 [Truepera radiovictrix DSM 17093]WMT57798.1 methyltransferase domain-containing protein [Truepera radiovictrix]
MVKRKPTTRPTPKVPAHSSWDPVAKWYNGWVGKRGSHYHRKSALPTVLALSDPQKGERVLDIGCGQGVLAPAVLQRGAAYLGVDASRTLVRFARQNHPEARFVHGDARRLEALAEVSAESFEVAVFMLSIQDMNPLEEVLQQAAWALSRGGRLVIFMVHPCFRSPRGSGWGYDAARKLTYRRVEQYLTGRRVPMKAYAEAGVKSTGTTLSFHRPLKAYVNTLAALGLLVDRLEELPDPHDERAPEIPLFAALRARKL